MTTLDTQAGLESLIWSWHEGKLFFERAVAFSPDALHAVTGVLIQLGAAIVIGKPVSSWKPWLVVLAVTFVNEVVDLSVERWPSPGMQYGETAKDVILTMLIPTLLLLSARYLPKIYAPRSLKDLRGQKRQRR